MRRVGLRLVTAVRPLALGGGGGMMMRRKGGVSRRYGAGLASRLAGGTYVPTVLRIA